MAHSASEIVTCATATANTAISVAVEVSVSSWLDSPACRVSIVQSCEGAVDAHKILMVS